MKLSSPVPPCCRKVWCVTGLQLTTHLFLLSAEVGISGLRIVQHLLGWVADGLNPKYKMGLTILTAYFMASLSLYRDIALCHCNNAVTAPCFQCIVTLHHVIVITARLHHGVTIMTSFRHNDVSVRRIFQHGVLDRRSSVSSSGHTITITSVPTHPLSQHHDVSGA